MSDISKSGIYKISNIITSKFYIGSATNLNNRWKYGHLRSLNLGNHKNRKLQNSYNKNGKDSFVFEVLEYCEKEKLIEKEQYYLDTLLFAKEYISNNDRRFELLGYNISPTAANVLGKKCDNSTKEKLSLINKGKPNYKNRKPKSEETKEKIRNTLIGRKRSPEAILKGSIKLRGKPKSKEHSEKVAKANTGNKRSDETKEKNSKSQLESYKNDPNKRINRSKKQKEVMQNMSEEWHINRNRKISETLKSKNKCSYLNI